MTRAALKQIETERDKYREVLERIATEAMTIDTAKVIAWQAVKPRD
jgi:hypothetical protein